MARPSPGSTLRAFRGSFTTMTAVTALIAACPALAGPTGGTVVAGQATIQQSGATTNINQSTNNAIINWQTFSIGRQETVNFFQPNSLSTTLNRVTGNEQSVIAGALNANGKVFIVNSAGILFTKGATVNVGGLVASTLDISNQDFMAGNYNFSGNTTGSSATPTGSVINKGKIHVDPNGYVALLGKTVKNDGTITAKLGSVVMASGTKLSLNFEGNSLLDVTISQGALNALVANKGAIIADGGTVILTAKAADAVLSAQVNNSGVIQARTMDALKGGGDGTGVRIGKIKLLADGGTVNVSGKLDASAPKGGNGGTIETSGNKVTVADNAVITTKAANGQNGNWLIDPDGFIIGPVNTYGLLDIFGLGGDISAATLSAELNNGNVTILSTNGRGIDGNILVTSGVSWSANTTLTLDATNAININAPISGSGANSGLTLNAGTDINFGSAVSVNNLTANAGNNINVNAPISYGSVGASYALNAANGGITINDAIAPSNSSATLALALNAPSANGNISINAPVTVTSLTMTYGDDYTIRTPASYSGTVLNADGIPVANTDTSGGIYGSITFKGTDSSGQTLTINGTPYTLIYSMSDLTKIDDGSTDRNGYSNGNGYYALASTLNANAANGAYTTATVNADGSTTYSYSNALVANLNGTLAGLGHTITGLTIDENYSATTSTPEGIGLIGQTATGSLVRDIGLASVSINVTTSTGINAFAKYVGTLVGYNLGGISGDYSTGTVTVASTVQSGATGGLIGYNNQNSPSPLPYISISNSYADVVVKGGSAGGLVGRAVYTDIYNSDATNDVSSYSGTIGGLIGYSSATNVYDSYATGAITGSGSSATKLGGLIGSANLGGDIENSYASGEVTGAYEIGGLIGIISAGANNYTINNSYATGDVNGSQPLSLPSNPGIGGLVGIAYTASTATQIYITNSHATGNVSVPGTYGYSVGGLVGSLTYGTVTSSYVTGDVTGATSGTATGGLIGTAASSTITDSYATGNVSGNLSVGGLVGTNAGGSSITESYATGNVTGAGNNIGGLVGSNSASSITDSHATGNVTGTGTGSWTGGLVGTNTGTITNSYATGIVTSAVAGMAGGLVGANFRTGTVTDSYYNSDLNNGLAAVGNYPYTDTIPPGTVTGSSGLTSAQFKDITYYQNGTINQVLADRAATSQAATAARQAALQQGAGTAQAIGVTDTQASFDRPPTPAISKAGTQAIAAIVPAKLEDNFPNLPPATTPVPRGEPKIHHANTTLAHHHGGGRGGANLRSIEINGQRFDLEKNHEQ